MILKNFRTYQLAVSVYRGCETVAAKHHLRDQLLRASLSVVLNLAEGSAKPSIKDRARFYGIAFASAKEVQSILQLVDQPELFRQADYLGACLYNLNQALKQKH